MKWWVLETLLFYSTSLLSTSLLRLPKKKKKKKKRPNNKDQKTSGTSGGGLHFGKLELRDASYLASSHWLPFHEIRKTSILFQALVLGNLVHRNYLTCPRSQSGDSSIETCR
uniref:Uncharacterized protein n=1 Tax=Spermophilus dauricus TaxID=99837 RepID=A0A8C9PKY6_SPEDA